MKGHWKQSHPCQDFFAKRRFFYSQSSHRHKKQQIADSSQISQPHTVQIQNPCQGNSQRLGNIGCRCSHHRRIRGYSQMFWLSGPNRFLAILKRLINQTIGFLRQNLSKNQNLSGILFCSRLRPKSIFLTIHVFPINVFQKPVLSPHQHMTIPAVRWLAKHMAGQLIGADIMADFIWSGKGWKHKQIQNPHGKSGKGVNLLQLP